MCHEQVISSFVAEASNTRPSLDNPPTPLKFTRRSASHKAAEALQLERNLLAVQAHRAAVGRAISVNENADWNESDAGGWNQACLAVLLEC